MLVASGRYTLVGRGAVEFEWDKAKRLSNFEKHNLDFMAIRDMFDGRPLLTMEVLRLEECRMVSTGLFEDRYCTVVWTARGSVIRIISARRPRDNERRAHRALHPQ